VKTFSSQPRKAARFGAERVTFVGDHGTIKAPQRIELGAANFHYIAAITKAQIDDLIGAGVLHMDLFEETLAEVEGKDGERYVVRRNPARAKELAASRPDKLATLRTAGQARASIRERRRRHRSPGSTNERRRCTSTSSFEGSPKNASWH
jgi:hypothetical protein